MNWKELKSEQQLDEVIELSKKHPVMIFKHSTRCSISSAAKGRMERHWDEKNTQNPEPYYLDLITFRSVSNKIASDLHVEHESPQVLVIKNGVCTYHTSHSDINYQEMISNC
ncbi:MAG: bacillithiol system redox-active protein YtxJ [Cytophagales bacterium]|nr:bacillithiol system redox-active protein YtxJ [Cytophagales bacterium]